MTACSPSNTDCAEATVTSNNWGRGVAWNERQLGGSCRNCVERCFAEVDVTIRFERSISVMIFQEESENASATKVVK